MSNLGYFARQANDVRALIGTSYAHLIRELAGDVFPGKIDILGRAGMQVRR